MSTLDRDARVVALAESLHAAFLADTKGCHWTEVPEAIGMLLKGFATALAAASDADDDRVDEISETMIRGFKKGWGSTVIVKFPPDS